MKTPTHDEVLSIQGAAWSLIIRLGRQVAELPGGLPANEESAARAQSVLSQMQLAQMALSAPLASLGGCHCGGELRYKGKTDGLYVCCTGLHEHCWKVAGP
jgi:hypothetical protein